MTKIKRDIYQEVTDRIIAMLENGIAPWKCTWNKYGLARNYQTGHIYTGINMFLMNCTTHPIPYFMTFKQVQKEGGRIKKGAKAEQVFYYNIIYKDSNDKTISQVEAKILRANKKKVKIMSFLKCYNVFGLDDIEEIDFKIDDVKLYENSRLDECDSIIQNMPNPPKIESIDSDRAFYSFEADLINMPSIKQFISSEAYYATYFHELVHSTGHSSRLSRSGIIDKVNFGDKIYSKEELIAEMGASFLCAHMGINYDAITENSAAYIEGWLKVLKEDKRTIFKASAEASKAVNLILNM